MTKYLVVFETTYAPQTSVQIIEAETAEGARQSLLDQVPQGAGIDVLVTNVVPADPAPMPLDTAEEPTLVTEAATEAPTGLVLVQ